MRRAARISGAWIVAGIVAFPTIAMAQLWDPLKTVPKPNAIIAHDTSVTMAITDNCGSCHNRAASRLETSKTDILATLPRFASYFNYGQFEYEGCGYAKVTSRIIPRPEDPTVLPQVMSAISSARACGSSESRLPGGTAGTCITGSCGFADQAKFMELVTRQLPGFDPLYPFRHNMCAYTYAGDGLPCMAGATPMLDTVGFDGGCFHHTDLGTGITCDFATLQANIATRFAAFSWPRWDPTGLTPGEVQTDFCNPMNALADAIRSDIEACFGGDPPMIPRSSYNTAVGSATFCDNVTIANNACQVGSPFYNTCVCDQTLPGCISGGNPTSPCGTTLDFKARQQVALCETRRPGPNTFYDFFRSQPDNVVNGATQCRENAVLFFTDGYMGHRTGAQIEAGLARSIYQSANPIGNMAIFRVANSFTGHANQMMSAVTGGNVTTAYPAINRVQMQSSFASLLNRIYQGNYSAASMTMDAYGTVAVIPAFTVPGYRGTAQPTDTYLSWPMRLSMHTVNPDGSINANPDWETDWAGGGGNDKARPAALCYNEFTGPTMTALPGGMIANRGPGGTFPNGVSRTQVVSNGQMDRNNIAGGDNIQPIRLGRMFGTARTKPVIVERAAADLGVVSPGLATAYANHLTAVSSRPRMIYTMGGGYLYGIHGGDAGATYSGNLNKAFQYDHTVPDAGREVIRYAPSWVDTQGSYDITLQPMLPQPLTTGQLTAREVYIDPPGAPPPTFATVLVGAQGSSGRGMFSMDVTDPCNPTVLAEWLLPAGASASNEPMIYNFPVAGVDFQRPAVVVTAGLGGGSMIYAYDIANGNLLASGTLPGGTDYPSEPVCVDTLGSGVITHCYAVGRNGTLARVEIDAGSYGFGPSRNITPAGVDQSQVYSTRPAVFYGPDGAVNLVFGSGDYERLTIPAGGNAVYKAIDRDSRRAGAGVTPADVATSCGGNTSGTIGIGNARVLSPPIVRKGIVAWTTYVPGTTGCTAGQADLYLMNYASCADANTGAPRPAGTGIGNGIPTSPIVHEQSATVVAGTSAGVTAAQTTAVSGLSAKGGVTPYVKRLYWRLHMPNP